MGEGRWRRPGRAPHAVRGAECRREPRGARPCPGTAAAARPRFRLVRLVLPAPSRFGEPPQGTRRLLWGWQHRPALGMGVSAELGRTGGTGDAGTPSGCRRGARREGRSNGGKAGETLE